MKYRTKKNLLIKINRLEFKSKEKEEEKSKICGCKITKKIKAFIIFFFIIILFIFFCKNIRKELLKTSQNISPINKISNIKINNISTNNSLIDNSIDNNNISANNTLTDISSINNNLYINKALIHTSTINNNKYQDIYNSDFSYNEIETKNLEFEKSDITTDKVQKRIDEINKNLPNFSNESNISSINEDSFFNKKINLDINEFLSFKIKKDNISEFNYSKNPKISLIIPVYKSEIYLLNLHYSIQRQSLKDIEIIYIDDNSTDNSVRLIKYLQKKDKRIILLKNLKNRGEFYSRNKAAMLCRGEYIQFIDSDDIIVNNILEKAYKAAKIKNVDVLQYKAFSYDLLKKELILVEEKANDGIVYQPELSDQMYYGRKRLQQDNFFIFNKIIKTEIFLKSLIFIGDEYLKENIYINEDLIQLFSILIVANSLSFISNIGYVKMSYEQKRSQTYLTESSEFANKVFHDNFLELKFLFEKSRNNEHDKAICIDFLRVNKMLYSSIIKNINDGYEFFDEVFNLLLNSGYYNDFQKYKINYLKNTIMNTKKSDVAIKP